MRGRYRGRLAVGCRLPAPRPALAGEDDLNVWQALATGLHGLDRLVEGTAADVLAGIVKLAGPTLASIGFEPGADDDRTLELRATLVRLLGTAGNARK